MSPLLQVTPWSSHIFLPKSYKETWTYTHMHTLQTPRQTDRHFPFWKQKYGSKYVSKEHLPHRATRTWNTWREKISEGEGEEKWYGQNESKKRKTKTLTRNTSCATCERSLFFHLNFNFFPYPPPPHLLLDITYFWFLFVSCQSPAFREMNLDISFKIGICSHTQFPVVLRAPCVSYTIIIWRDAFYYIER